MNNNFWISTKGELYKSLFLAMFVFVTSIFAEDRKINDDSGTAWQKNPALAASYAGYGVACWEDYRNGDPDIYAQVVRQNGQPVDVNFVVNDAPTTGKQVRPAVAMNCRGQFVVVWEDSSADGDVVLYARWFAANLKPLGARIRVNSANARGRMNAAVAMDHAGNAVVCWGDGRDRETLEIYLQRYDPLGRPLGANRRVNDVIVGVQQFPAVSANSEGAFVIVWDDTRNDYSHAVYGQRYSAFGTPLGPNRLLSHHVGHNDVPMFPSVALQENGDYMTAWNFMHGAPPQVYGCFISNTDSSLNKEFILSDAGGGATFIATQDPCVYPRPETGFLISFVAFMLGNDDHIYTRSFDAAGNAEAAPVRRSEVARNKRENCLVIGQNGIHILIWAEKRDTHQDIYGQCWMPKVPLNVVAGSGFNGCVPISWDPPFSKDNVTRYTIRRSIHTTGPFALIATVDLTARGAAGSLMRDWIDASVTNGTTYYYFVTAEASGTDGASQLAKATPSATGHVLVSPWTITAPIIDGVIDEVEWQDARKMNIAVPCSDHPVELYVKNDGAHLYLAADDPLDTVIDPLNQLCVLYDLNHNAAWPAGPAGNEGLLSISAAGAWIVGYYGTYPDHLGANAAVKATNVASKVSTGSGHVQYEAAITIAHTAGQTIGFSAWLQDPGSNYAMHYGWAGEWPFGSLWETAGSLGDLVFSGQPAAPNKYSVTNTLDSGPGSLRQAVLDAEAHNGADSVLFRIPTTDPGYDVSAGVWTIRLLNSIPLTKKSTIVDGTSQARFLGLDPNPLGPEIVLDGAQSAHTFGINISGNNNHIKGLCIQNFKYQFIMIYGDSNRVSNCYLGVDPTGMHRVPNTAYGLVLYGGDYNVIGGSSQERNVISGMDEDGVQIKAEAHYNRIAGNYIGINAAGSDTVANWRGVAITFNCKYNIVGPANVISGNKQYGVALTDNQCENNRIIGNFIGTDVSGRAAMGNAFYGVYIEDCAYNRIGGATAQERNIISGNDYAGIYIKGAGAAANIVQGNHIGVDVSGSAALRNKIFGVRLHLGAHNTLIGGEQVGQGNVIGANGQYGIVLEGSGTNDNQIIGNFIGTDSSGTLNMGNGLRGVSLSSGACNNVIGPNNLIAFNRHGGVALVNDDVDYNQFTQNRIYQNQDGGIIFMAAGANQGIAAPTLTTIHPISGQSFPYATIELFSTSANQADLYEGTVVADGAGHFNYGNAVSGALVTATATDAANNTSPLSLPLATGVGAYMNTQPFEFDLEQNYPNPFNPVTTIRFCVQEPCRVQLAVFDVLGRQTAVLVDEFYAPGRYEKSVQMPAHASGVYFYRIKMKNYSACKKMILLQ